MGSIEERSIVTPIREMAYGSLTDRGLPLKARGLDGLYCKGKQGSRGLMKKWLNN